MPHGPSFVVSTCVAILTAACLDTSRPASASAVAATGTTAGTPTAGTPTAAPPTPGTPSDPMPTAPLVSATLAPRPDTAPRSPLLVLLHGYGSNEHDLLELARHLDPRFRVVSFRAPLQIAPSSNAWFAVRFQPGGDNAIDLAQWERSRLALIDAVGAAVKAYGTDPARTYVLGFSQGSMMALSLLLTRPDLVAGAIAHSGRYLPELDAKLAAPELLAKKPILLLHGVSDPVLPVEQSRKALARLQQLPVEVSLFEFPGAHTVTPGSLDAMNAFLKARLGP